MLDGAKIESEKSPLRRINSLPSAFKWANRGEKLRDIVKAISDKKPKEAIDSLKKQSTFHKCIEYE